MMKKTISSTFGKPMPELQGTNRPQLVQKQYSKMIYLYEHLLTTLASTGRLFLKILLGVVPVSGFIWRTEEAMNVLTYQKTTKQGEVET
jgi:hypothetical protein